MKSVHLCPATSSLSRNPSQKMVARAHISVPSHIIVHLCPVMPSLSRNPSQKMVARASFSARSCYTEHFDPAKRGARAFILTRHATPSISVPSRPASLATHHKRWLRERPSLSRHATPFISDPPRPVSLATHHKRWLRERHSLLRHV